MTSLSFPPGNLAAFSLTTGSRILLYISCFIVSSILNFSLFQVQPSLQEFQIMGESEAYPSAHSIDLLLGFELNSLQLPILLKGLKL